MLKLVEELVEGADRLDPCHLDQGHLKEQPGVAGLCDLFCCCGQQTEHLLDAFRGLVGGEFLDGLKLIGGEVDDLCWVLDHADDHHIAQQRGEFLGQLSDVVGIGEEVFDMAQDSAEVTLE